MPVKIKKTRLLIVEGKDEENFFNALFNCLEIDNIQILPIGGVTQINKNLKALRISPDFSAVQVIGIVRDADLSPVSAFQSVCGHLQCLGFPVPDKPLSIAGNNLKISIMILPSFDRKGNLEELFIDSEKDSPAIECVNQYFKCLEEKKLPLPCDNRIAKARVHVFLASKEEPDKRPGEAALAGYWNFKHRAFDEIKKFINIIATV